MLTLYLACLIFGGGLLVVSMSGGGDADGDVHGGSDAGGHGGVDGDPGIDHHVPADHGHAHGGGHAAHHGIAAAQFLNFRNLVFFTAFFGAAGTALTLLRVPALLTVASSTAMGSTAAIAITRVLAYLQRTESGRVENEKDFEGMPARVLVEVGVAQTGKISIDTDERSLQLLARVAEESSRERFIAGEAVLIVRVENGVAQVAGEDFVS